MVAIRTFLTTTALLSAVAYADEAPANTDSNKKAVARAHLDRGLVKGVIEFTSDESGIVKVHLDVTGLPPNAGPFNYHIYDSKVSSKGDCDDAGEILNPYGASTDVVCDSFDNDSHCAVGDLSGKHGYINTTCFETHYTDPYLSLNSRNGAFVGGKSIVITDLDDNKISCGAIKMKRSARTKREVYESQEEEYDASLYETLIPEPVLSKNTTNSTYHEDETSDDYDSSANMMISSGLAAVVACGLSVLM
ncbi:hypothetical protein CANINC_000787 [Pichia inconspicua]|uniref:Superoxide dismutase copper/zinc binding domain-containing protein n=1 Tax=Pichia inconspicua TaxID=52247 RepID=A0A4T0X6J7_9ASCO|nr:hypothetical protein CANINC_000787 [[Candida] inconspicua]